MLDSIHGSSDNPSDFSEVNFAEVNFDGLVGPTHNYGGLSVGNLASMEHKDKISNPQMAALQGLQKMRFLLDQGLTQAILPPQERPNSRVLASLGYRGNIMEMTQQIKENELLFRNVMSASSMWVANAATVSPSLDTLDGKVHLTTANLSSGFHRALEADQTTKVLSRIFNHHDFFSVHPSLGAYSGLNDEGAANHGRLCSAHGKQGVEVFVYGRSAFDAVSGGFPRRQTREASETIARIHGLSESQCVFLQQSEAAINAGVFHNDVISVVNENVFLLHEKAFVNQQEALEQIVEKCDFDVCFLEISEQELPLADAVSSYLFNSQLLTLTNGSMALLLPTEVEENANALACVKRLIADKSNPIEHSYFMDLRQSMCNGGGPACLRLRVLLNQTQINALSGAVILNHEVISNLEHIVKKYYRAELHPRDLHDSHFIQDSFHALNDISRCLSLEGIYDFQA